MPCFRAAVPFSINIKQGSIPSYFERGGGQGAQNFLKHFRRTQNYRLGEFKILSRRIQVCKFLPRFARFLRCCPVFILMEMPFCPKAGHFLPCFKILPSNFYLYFLFTIFFYFSSLFL